MSRRKRPGKEEVLNAVRAVFDAAGGKPMGIRRFSGAAGMSTDDVYRHFPAWVDAVRTAGYEMEPYRRRIDDGVLLADWAGVVRKIKRAPTQDDYQKHGKYGLQTIRRRFRGLVAAQRAFRKFAAKDAQWKDVLDLLPERAPVPRKRKPTNPFRRRYRQRGAAISNGRPICGPPLRIDGMLNAPMNEQGVIFLFAILAGRLGFQVEALQREFPDCEAKRLVGTDAWQSVRIEFEYESRNFRDHGHRAEGCDIIVCWVHNWAECPKNLEVIELSELVKGEYKANGTNGANVDS